MNNLGDEKPSHMVSHLLSTLDEYGTNIFLQQAFLCILPTHIQDTLAGCDLSDTEVLGDKANTIMSRPCQLNVPVWSTSPPKDNPLNPPPLQNIFRVTYVVSTILNLVTRLLLWWTSVYCHFSSAVKLPAPYPLMALSIFRRHPPLFLQSSMRPSCTAP